MLECYKRLGLVVSPDKTETISLAKPSLRMELGTSLLVDMK